MSNVRFEHKYLITTTDYIRLKNITKKILKTSNSIPRQYPVCSLYFDSESREYFFQKINGEYKHTKIRIRKYSKDFFDQSCFWVEKKIKIDDRITKIRNPLLNFSISSNIEEWSAVCQPYAIERARYKLLPSCFIYYEREAFEDILNGKKLRITFDKDISAFEYGKNFDQRKSIFDRYENRQIIMEIKFPNEQYPQFLRNILHSFSIKRVYFSKYAEGLQRLFKLV